MIEEWKEISGWDGRYEISNFGRVKSNSIGIVFKNSRKRLGDIIMKPVYRNGYATIKLSKNGVSERKSVHQLVAIEFLGHIPYFDGFVVDHINGLRGDNVLSNLQLKTKRENCTVCFRSDRNYLSSKYSGVTKFKGNGKWNSKIFVDGVTRSLGYYHSELDASNAYQAALLHVNDGTFDEYYSIIKNKKSSKYKFVSWNKSHKKWMSYIIINKKTIHIGHFNTEEDAYEAYLLKLNSLHKA